MINSNPKNTVKLFEEYYRGERSKQNEGRITSPGNQYLIHLIKGGYLCDYSNCNQLKVLDVGCGSGFNLVSFAMMGWQVYGCEISEGVVDHAKTSIQQYGYHAEIKVGDNQDTHFPSNYFDLLLSMNVIHYVPSEEGIQNTIKEYARVLKKSGRVIMMTNHPDNWILRNGELVGNNLIRINNSNDYRHGEIFYVFKNRKELKEKYSHYFSDLQIGENQQEFFTRRLKHFILTGIKKCHDSV
ncbi:class I SAM-dependent methyltransferase [Candidatus Magnetominusculus xianensis]|uniref:Type 11 methyltransferase n=1 Tax=Candidatus Magnetominusculus xianensis TaxID=1748249 RepID=A0ABR5SHI3_9BACT|nr:class I SAM-dependent methyltransferase [Candidatus Magnetominusculus xianensis]KWT91553.1 type 11 methyltransferase [Candidatus Magnetominusculus xianensis]MBF0404339.1 class I SAM-dependent methyltransferase [Nitrospirota bacterium]